MSYDVSVSDSFNYTSNMGDFFEHFVGQRIPALDGMAAPEADRLLTLGLVRISQSTSRELRTFDADNGWGSWDSATEFIRNIRDDCRNNPDEIVQVSY